ncbi:hypothetical protein E8D34_12905 [Nocardioides sp. GY 10113]|uniref:hypothetical protein n=1 Tax=Nocardioides sp. GY 10113 TaxID=2569761 RepID=UPI0010A8EAA3|nr:hypothetical protein [Nocardioides sp. GY 10113]TIC84982.1 hypothetical protein E8D34_12905 [Nocardioides sp. GY 10113]
MSQNPGDDPIRPPYEPPSGPGIPDGPGGFPAPPTGGGGGRRGMVLAALVGAAVLVLIGAVIMIVILLVGADEPTDEPTDGTDTQSRVVDPAAGDRAI